MGVRGTQRINFVVSDALVERLKEVRDETGASTLTEVFKNALRLYIAAVVAQKRGETIVFRSTDKNTPDRPIDIEIGLF